MSLQQYRHGREARPIHTSPSHNWHKTSSFLLLQRLVERHQQQYRYGRELDRLEMARDVVWGQREEWRLREVTWAKKMYC